MNQILTLLQSIDWIFIASLWPAYVILGFSWIAYEGLRKR